MDLTVSMRLSTSPITVIILLAADVRTVFPLRATVTQYPPKRFSVIASLILNGFGQFYY